MMEAQRFPWDFDGIIAGAPSLAPSRNVMDWLWANRQMTDRSVVPALGKSQLDLVHQSVIEKCDLNDGVKDGLIGTRAAATSIPQRSCAARDAKASALPHSRLPW